MPRQEGAKKWIETGYLLFAQEGLQGIQIERMARMLGLNKSSFYHYFGTLEIFVERLVVYHHENVELLIIDAKISKSLDPDFLNAVIKRQVTVMVQVHLKRCKNNSALLSIAKLIDEQMNLAVLPIWSKYIGITHNENLAYRYLEFVRDAFYARIAHENFTYPFLHEFTTGVKEIADQMQTQNFLLKVNA